MVPHTINQTVKRGLIKRALTMNVFADNVSVVLGTKCRNMSDEFVIYTRFIFSAEQVNRLDILRSHHYVDSIDIYSGNQRLFQIRLVLDARPTAGPRVPTGYLSSRGASPSSARPSCQCQHNTPIIFPLILRTIIAAPILSVVLEVYAI